MSDYLTLSQCVGVSLFLFYVFCMAIVFCVATPKFMRHPSEDQLERTDNLWLSLISPFHMLSSEAENHLFDSGGLQPGWIDFIWTMIKASLWGIAYVVMLPVSIAGGGIYLMIGILWAMISGIGKAVRDYGARLTKMIR